MRSSLRSSPRRLVLIVVLLLVAAMIGTTASGAPRTKNTLTISGHVVGLYPGGQKTARLKVTNHYPWRIDVRHITATSTRTNKPGCSRVMVTSPGWTGARTVRKGRTVTIALPIRMSPAAPDACQGATFTLAYKGRGVRR